MKPIRILIVDDEPLARRALQQAIGVREQVASITECASCEEALPHLLAGAVDVLFLDIRVGELSGIDLVRTVGVDRMPLVVFVSAHDEHALEAFDMRALDYLLKPFTRMRFEDSFARVLRALAAAPAPSPAGPGGIGDSPPLAGSLRIKTAGRTLILALQEVLWVSAANTYVRVHTREQAHLLRASISSLEAQLDARMFLRVHRSAIVQVDCIRELRHLVRGDYELTLVNGDKLRASRRYRERLLDRVKDVTLW